MEQQKNSWTHNLLYHMSYGIAKASTLVPEFIVAGICHCLAWLCHDVLHMRRKVSDTNTHICFGASKSPRERARLGRSSWYHLSRNFVCTLKFSTFSPDKIRKQVRVVGREHFEVAHKKGNGVIFLSLHLGNWEIMSSAVNVLVTEALALVKAVNPLWMDDLLIKLRKNAQVETISKRFANNVKIVFTIIRLLKQGGAVGYILDQYRPGDTPVPFFDIQTKTNSGLAVLAEQTRAAVVPVYCVPTGLSTFELVFLPEVEMDFSADRQTNIYQNTRKCNHVLEDIIRQHPDKWFYLHKRWKNSLIDGKKAYH